MDRLSVDIRVHLIILVTQGLRADHFKVRGMTSVLVTLFALLLLSPALSAHPVLSQGNAQSLVVVRGRAVCLDALGRDEESFLACNETNSRFGVVSKSGKLYKFLPSDPMTPIFTDSRIRQRELQISARLHSGDQLEIIKVQSVKEGKLYDVYYFCAVCNITAYVPGLCPCCRAELEFKETPP